MKLHLHPYDLELKAPFTITHGTRTHQPTLIVELGEGQQHGLGEATATSYYGLTLDGMQQTLEELRPQIEHTHLRTPEIFWEAMHPHLASHPFEHCALDIAAHDLHGRRLGKPLYQVWGLSLRQLPQTNYTIGIGTIDEMIAKIREMPWPLYKIKLGTDHDLEIVRALRAVTPARLRVDANTGWTAEQTIELAPALKELGVEFIEQPLKPDDWDGMKRVFEKSVLPVIADESCQREDDVDRCRGFFHGINIKLMKCGGLTPARRMIARARQLGMQVMVGCMTESTVGISAIAHLLPLLDYVDMDGPLLLKKDIATGVVIETNGVRFPDSPGTGAELLD